MRRRSRFEQLGEGLPDVPGECVESPAYYFEDFVPRLVRDHPEVTDHFGHADAVIQFDVTGAGRWYMELAAGAVHVGRGCHQAPSFTIIMPVETWRGLGHGELNYIKEWLRGRIKLRGNKRAMFRVGRLFQ